MPNIAAPALVCVRGETRTYTLTHQTSESNTTAVNITGWAIGATVSKSPIATGTPALVSLTGTVTNGAAGTYTLAFTHASTMIEPGVYTLEIWRTDSGSETQMASGTFTVAADVRY